MIFTRFVDFLFGRFSFFFMLRSFFFAHSFIHLFIHFSPFVFGFASVYLFASASSNRAFNLNSIASWGSAEQLVVLTFFVYVCLCVWPWPCCWWCWCCYRQICCCCYSVVDLIRATESSLPPHTYISYTSRVRLNKTRTSVFSSHSSPVAF